MTISELSTLRQRGSRQQIKIVSQTVVDTEVAPGVTQMKLFFPSALRPARLP